MAKSKHITRFSYSFPVNAVEILFKKELISIYKSRTRDDFCLNDDKNTSFESLYLDSMNDISIKSDGKLKFGNF
ncbi:MAG TPA: hypothetical protein PLB11_16785 [Flavobacterium sp.]|nr:hypothetical protein [Flavobacterium sp.]